MLTSQDNLRDKAYAESLGDLAKSCESISRNVGNSLRRSVTFSEHHLPKGLEDSLKKRALQKEYERIQERSQSFGGLPVPEDKASWYTQPIHISRQEYSLSPRHGASSRSRSPHKYSGTIGAALSLQEDRDLTDEEKEFAEHLSLSFEDSIGLKYFPVTLGASYELSDLDRKLAKLENKPRPRTAGSYVKTSYEPGTVNSMYFMESEAPVTRKYQEIFLNVFDMKHKEVDSVLTSLIL